MEHNGDKVGMIFETYLTTLTENNRNDAVVRFG